MTGELFPHAVLVSDPEVVYLNTRGNPSRSSYLTKKISGSWYLVRPTNAAEMNALRRLKHEVEKFAPAEGDGVLITMNALLKIQG